MNTKLQIILEELQCSFKTLYGERLARIVLYGSQVRGDVYDMSVIDCFTLFSAR